MLCEGDLVLTQHPKQALTLIDVGVLHHVIVTRQGSNSTLNSDSKISMRGGAFNTIPLMLAAECLVLVLEPSEGFLDMGQFNVWPIRVDDINVCID